MLFYTTELKTLYFVFICSAEDLFTLTSNEFRMVDKVDRNPQFDSRDWSMYLNILKTTKLQCSFLNSRGLSGLVYLRPLGVNPS